MKSVSLRGKLAVFAMTAAVSVMTLGSPMIVFAVSNGENATISDYLGSMDKVPASISSRFTISDDGNLDSCSGADWRVYTGKDGMYYYIKQDAEEAAAARINNVGAAGDVSDDVKNIQSTLDVGADVATAGVLLSGFVPILSTLLGLMVTLISIGMTIFSGFDLCYIAFPVFRNKCEEAKASGNNMMTKKGSNGESKLRFVTDDAQYAVQAADTVQSGKNPFVIYFSKRLLSYIVLAILLFILLTGNITVFTSIALKVVSGILEVIGQF